MGKKLCNHNIGIVLLVILHLVLALATIHGYARGREVGLYLATVQGKTDTVLLDVLVDVCALLALSIMVLCPFLLLGYRRLKSFFRMLVIYLALIPTVDMSALVHLADGHKLLVVDFDLIQNLYLLADFRMEIFATMIVLGSIYCKKGCVIQAWHKILLVLAGAAGIGMLVLPELSGILMYWTAYFLIIIVYDIAEKVFAASKEPYEKIVLWLLIALLFGRGCYKMLSLLNAYPI